MGTGKGTTGRIAVCSLRSVSLTFLRPVPLSVSYLLKTCKHILSCTEYFVREKDAYRATQASHDGCLVGEGQKG